ncbi:MAG: PKD domain-containing protein [Thermoplasmata archaeon]|nr:PKD domain-containing protein [Thermoplasmata archaeon]
MVGTPVRAVVLVLLILLLLAWTTPSASPIGRPSGAPRGASAEAPIHACPAATDCGVSSPVPTPARPTPSNNSSGGGGANGTTGWVQLPGVYPTPGDRTQPSFAYDPNLGKVVMFGGYDGNGNTQRGDTWTFQNDTWTDLTSSVTGAPSARWGGQMVWDPSDQLLVMFGGRTQSQFLNDTWTFNGTAWVNVSSSVAPAPRAHYEMAYDPVDQYILLVGGDVENFGTGTWSLYNDTWSWSNGTWTNISGLVTGTLPPRIDGQASYDPWNNSVVVEAGAPAEGCVVGSPVTAYRTDRAWSYPSSVGPQNVSQGMMTYDPLGPFLFAYGGELMQTAGCPQTNETWVRANGTWVEITAAAGLPPTARYLSGIAYDAHDQEVVLFGGNSLGGYMSDTWVYRIQPVVAQFAASRNVSSAPFVATFTANATGGSYVYDYNWSFGDGNYSTAGGKVTHTYPRVGVYTVSLKVTDLLGRNNSTNLTVHVIRPVAASTSASSTVGAVPFLVNFTVSATGGLGLYNFSWDFGDGSTAIGPAPSHTYTFAGNFTASCITRDAYGDSNRSALLIQVAPRLVVSAAASPTTGIVPFQVNVSASPRGGNPPYSYSWSFGDGATATTANASHLYPVAGTYTASLIVADRLGHASRYSTVVHAFAPLSVSVASNVSLGVVPLPVSLSASSAGGNGLGNFTWIFDDASSPGYGPAQNHVFGAPGRFTVQVTVADLNHTATTSVVVTVVAPLAVRLSAAATTGEVGLPFQFTAHLAGGGAPINLSWNFGDGTSATGGLSENHSYAQAGSFTVRLSANDALAEHATVSIVVGVVRPLTVSVVDQAPSVVLGSSDNLTATIAGGAAPFSLVWSGLPPGCPTAPAPSLTCTPNATGSYTISLTVSDHDGVRVVGSVTMLVTPPPSTTSSSGPGSTVPLTLLLVGVGVAAVAVGVLVALLRRRARRPVDESPEPDPETPGDDPP